MTKRLSRKESYLHLFIDLCVAYGKDTSRCKYTTHNKPYQYEGKTYPSLYSLYMAMEDESEYFFAKEYFDSWKQWVLASESPHLRNKLVDWREELQIALKAKELKRVKVAAEEGDVQSSKWLLDKHWQSTKPTKQVIKGKVVNKVQESEQVQTTDINSLFKRFESLTETKPDHGKKPN